MYKPLDGIKVKFEDYFKNSNFRIHLIGVFGGIIWCAGMTLSLLSSEIAGYPISVSYTHLTLPTILLV